MLLCEGRGDASCDAGVTGEPLPDIKQPVQIPNPFAPSPQFRRAYLEPGYGRIVLRQELGRQ
jgi:hypothetical protein